MDIRGFVYQIVDIFPSPLRTPARWVADRVFGVWNDVSAVFRITVPFWQRWYNSTVGLASSFIVAGNEIALTIRWIVAQWAPAFVLDKVNAVRNFVVGLLNDARRALEGLINGAVDFARKGISTALDFATRIRDYFADRVREIWSTLTEVARLVGNLLTNPDRLATWVAGAMFWALLRVVDALIEPIVDYLWARRQAVVLKTLTRIESIIARLL